MDRRIIYSTSDGGVAVIVPAPGCGLTIEQIALKDAPAGADVEIVSVASIPADRTFRNAWQKNGRAIGHDMTKARSIAHDRRRAKRAEEFAPLDVEATIPAKAAQAEAARQSIRDKYAAIQVNIDAAPDVAALKAIVEAM